jgi:tryptophanyl-tRNA synthetase
MSKSAVSPNGVVSLLDTPKQVMKKFKSAVTDSGSEIVYDVENKPGISNLLAIYSAMTNEPIDKIVADFEGKQYGHLKVALAEIVADFVDKFGTRTRELLDDRGEIDRILARGAQQAREVASATLELVYDRSGFVRQV